MNSPAPAAGLLRPALMLLAFLTALTGFVYPLLVTGIAQLVFTDAARGSLLTRDGVAVASRLVGQNFSAPGYFWSRPSATAPFPYNAAASGGSNLGPLNPALQDAVRQRIAALRAQDPDNRQAVPIDLVTASGSGLDPEESLAAVEYQIPRVARARNLGAAQLQRLVDSQTKARTWAFLGDPRVNVVQLNLALDALAPGIH